MPPSKIARIQEASQQGAYREGPLAPFLSAGSVFDLSQIEVRPEPESQAVVFAPYVLQDISDYRDALQSWFACVTVGGFLVLTVPHAFLYERQDAAPSRRRATQRRLYTPRALIEEVEEALVPNSYRVRWLGDLDQGYDYTSAEPVGRHDVGVALERIVAPAWGLAEVVESRPAPSNVFEPGHTRVESVARASVGKILALKLDHLGDFVMGIPALERLRAAFPAADLTLVVGSWNESLAKSLAVANRVVVFDAYPRNSAEERPDIGGKTAMFDALITEHYDLAIDLRTDPESRFLLRNVRAPLKAGLGLKAHFPYLDIFLPVDQHIGHYDTAWSETFDPDRFHAQDYCVRSRFSIECLGDRVDAGDGAIVYGPYRALPPGNYVFEPFLEIDSERPGVVACDVALNTQRVAYQVLAERGNVRLSFESTDDHAAFEFRLFPLEGEPTANVRFYGGRLSKRGTASSLHQSEYLILLVDLISLRLREAGVFGNASQ